MLTKITSFDETTSKLRDEVAKIAYAAVVSELGTNIPQSLSESLEHLKLASKAAATVSWEFADAFMRERYERSCVQTAGVDLDKIRADFNKGVK